MELTPDWLAIHSPPLYPHPKLSWRNFASSRFSIFDQPRMCIERTGHAEVREILHLAQIYLEAALFLPSYIPLLAPLPSIPSMCTYFFSFFSHHFCPWCQSLLNKRLLAMLQVLEYRIRSSFFFSLAFCVFLHFLPNYYLKSDIGVFFFLLFFSSFCLHPFLALRTLRTNKLWLCPRTLSYITQHRTTVNYRKRDY